jgi:DNA polymerase-4
MRTILHVDMDSFFATCEQQANPFLRGKPVGILKAEGRNCVIAASVEAKKYGVKTGTNVWEAKKLCPKIFFLPADFDKYFAVTKKFLKIAKEFTPLVELFSIDELFLDVTKTKGFFGGEIFLTVELKERIKRQIGEWISCSVGISYNKLLAKIASGINKPDGIFVIDKKNKDEVLGEIKLTNVCGIGLRIEARLKELGVTNLLQLRRAPYSFLETSFGPFWAQELKRFSYGESSSRVILQTDLPEAKSVSRTFTLFSNTTDETVVRRTIYNLCCEIGQKLRQMKMVGRCFGLAIRGENWGDFRRWTQKRFIDDEREIFEVCWQLYKAMNWRFSVRFLGVWVSLLEKRQKLTLDIFPEAQKREKVLEAVDRINMKFGEFCVYPGRLLGGEIVRPEVNGYLGDKKYRFML